MKVYAVIGIIELECFPDFELVIEDHVYLKEEDAKKRLNELSKEHRWSTYEIREFEVKE